MATPPAFKETNGWKMAQPQDDVIRGKWWEMFHDPQLSTLEDQLTRSNQNVQAAFFTFLEARAAVRQTWSSLFPTAAVTPSATRSRVASSGSLFSVSGGASSGRTATVYALPFDATWEPDLWGNIRNSVRAGAYAAQASAANLENIRLTAQAELAVDYYEMRVQDSLKLLLGSTVVAYQKSLDLNKALYGTGINSEENVAQAETQLKTTEAQATGVDIQRAQFEHAIAVLVGQPASTFSIPVAPLDGGPPVVPVNIPSELLERRPDIAAAERSVAQANAQIGVARAAYFPTLTLSASAGYQSTSLSQLISPTTFIWSVGAQMAETLFDAGRRKAATDQAKAAYSQTVASYRQTVLAAFQAVEDNLASLRVLSTQTQQQHDAVASAEHTLAIATHRYQLGIDSYLNVITAQTALLLNQQTDLTLRQQQMTATVQLIMALGGGWKGADLPAQGQLLSHAKFAPAGTQ